MSLKDEQIASINIVNWFHETFPEFADDFHHFANERRCSQHEGRTLKRMGVKRGVPDYFLALSCGGYHGMWMEVKVGKGKLLKEQIDFLDRKTKRGYMCMAVWGEEAAKAFILSYMDLLKTNCFINKPKNCE